MLRLIAKIAFGAVVCAGLEARADQVHYAQRTDAAGSVAVISDITCETGSTLSTVVAPSKSGYIFTHWSISTIQDFTNRDCLGRALDSVSFVIYENTTLTANYMRLSEDSDQDGVADGYELYWYGSLDRDGADDGDGDGYTFAEEIANGTNPLFADDFQSGLIAITDGANLQYNPNVMHAYIVRSEPEGALFASLTDTVKFGTPIPVPALGAGAYWTVNGAVQRDALGRALDNLSLTMPNCPLEVVAHTAANTEERNKLYWYGTTEVEMTSDTDGDGYTFAEELANGTNPLFADDFQSGLIAITDGANLQYNPNVTYAYVVRSEPEGALFATITDTVRVGSIIRVPSLGAGAYWTVNGVAQRDSLGRAIDVPTITMPNCPLEVVAHTAANTEERNKLYWYGTTEVEMTSDTDGDGYTFAEELANGTNPLFADDFQSGLITYRDGETLEVNLQIYETVGGAVVDGVYGEFDGFGSGVTPVVADASGDGLWDLVVVSDGATNVYVNVGSKGNPRFERAREEVAVNSGVLNMNSTEKLASLVLDIAPVGALSATTWNDDTLLVSDNEGRIWYYVAGTLQHKVWGGSYAGFAEGLQLAAVDWEDDGDLDCLCGTADGRLFLLRNPKVGRPTNLIALAGVDNVLLLWDPVPQSRVRGYKVYRDGNCLEPPVRALGGTEGSITSALPMYRDSALAPGDYAYEVTSLSRFYTAGNSEPMIVESVPSESVRAHIEDAELTIHEPFDTEKGTVEVIVSINNSVNYDAVGRVLTIDYTSDLEYLGVLKSDLSLDLRYTLVEREGQVELTITEGELLPGSGTVFTFVFRRIVTVGPTILKGDVDGNGVVDKEDLKLLARLKDSVNRKWTDEQLNAGDLNGNGRLDNGDYQALKALLKEGGK